MSHSIDLPKHITVASYPPTPPNDLLDHVHAALSEDIGHGDITAQLITEDRTAQARLIIREPAVICGIPWANAVFNAIDPALSVEWHCAEGEYVQPNCSILTIAGNARSILTAERSAINFLQTLSGTATTTQRWVALIASTRAKLLDTRKTIPGLRSAQKYAVAIGGGINHRMGLFDAFLIKENHIIATGSISAAIATARRLDSNKPVEVEVENLTEFAEALSANPDIILLDNFSLADIEQALTIRAEKHAIHCTLEASGGINESNVLQIAQTGIDFISVGALTKNLQSIDFSMRFSLD